MGAGSGNHAGGTEREGRREERAALGSHRLLSSADLDRGCFSLLRIADCVRHQGSVKGSIMVVVTCVLS